MVGQVPEYQILRPTVRGSPSRNGRWRPGRSALRVRGHAGEVARCVPDDPAGVRRPVPTFQAEPAECHSPDGRSVPGLVFEPAEFGLDRWDQVRGSEFDPTAAPVGMWAAQLTSCRLTFRDAGDWRAAISARAPTVVTPASLPSRRRTRRRSDLDGTQSIQRLRSGLPRYRRSPLRDRRCRAVRVSHRPQRRRQRRAVDRAHHLRDRHPEPEVGAGQHDRPEGLLGNLIQPILKAPVLPKDRPEPFPPVRSVRSARAGPDGRHRESRTARTQVVEWYFDRYPRPESGARTTTVCSGPSAAATRSPAATASRRSHRPSFPVGRPAAASSGSSPDLDTASTFCPPWRGCTTAATRPRPIRDAVVDGRADEERAAVATAVDRCHRVRADDLHHPAADPFQVFARTGDRAAGFDAGNEVG